MVKSVLIAAGMLGLVISGLWLLFCAMAHADRLWRWRKSQR